MELMTKELERKFPKLGDTEGKDPEEVEIVAKFFDPSGIWTWYATEFDGKDIFFGFIKGFERELGYFSLKELKSIKGAFGLGIERDLHFEKHTLAEIVKNDFRWR